MKIKKDQLDRFYYHVDDGRIVEEIFNDECELIGFKCLHCHKIVQLVRNDNLEYETKTI